MALDDDHHAGEGNTLVLGGGGVAGIAWMTGLIFGLSERGLDPHRFNRIIGTSAGAVVAVMIAASLTLEEHYQRQVLTALQVREVEPPPDAVSRLLQVFGEFVGDVDSPVERARRLAAMAPVGGEAERLDVIANRLPSRDWPVRPITLVAVDADSGEPRLFDRNSGVDLIDAVAASCAVPGIWPPVKIDGRRYIDGGVRSSDNADLAEGAAHVLIISPVGLDGPATFGRDLSDQRRKLEENDTKVRIICPSESSRLAMGSNPLATGTRTAAAEAGRSQALQLRDCSVLQFDALH
ncbi:patatin-like phospholipase family protein [Sphingopyxis macrogoltabida]|uniref:PNPLA domain-containing protein n=1 Tax=Sphingopyxis macrogoltabida TaxID=33050 RepID=A0AAC9FHR8_SPHMC|nr:patatin-like phospholipase family protein [Sphingopyxis macrogoltabida]AMU92630.1 hypothetical protein ATM17_30705 [Sphingopyxis macrogoltabida]